jgi:predicted SnoaL-like aldol condensation-catalyzing enzyme
MSKGIAAAMVAIVTAVSCGSVSADVKPKNANEAAVVGLLDLAFNQRKFVEAFDKYVGPYYRQHNPTVPDGKEALMASMKQWLPTVPGLHYEFKHLYSDGDRVIVHSLVTMAPQDRGMAVIDIFRIENGKIVEHWDVVQPVPEKALNDNTMF